MNPISKLIHVIWLWVILVAAPCGSCATFAYDYHNEIKPNYDGCHESAITYDGVPAHNSGAEKDGTTEKRLVFAKFAEFLATGSALGESDVIASGQLSHLNGAIGEAQGWESALNNGQIGIQPPGKVTAPGVDFATFDPAKNQVVLSDAKYRGPGGSYPSSVPASKVPGWTQEVRGTVDAMPDGPLKQQIISALNNGRVRTEIFRWPQ